MSKEQVIEIAESTSDDSKRLENGHGSASEICSLEIYEHRPLDILAEQSVKIDEKYVVKLTVEGDRKIDREAKRNVKILKISTEWNFNEVLEKLDSLDNEEYLHLFIFIIETEKGRLNETIEEFEKLKSVVIKFDETRPLVLQLTSKEENTTKFFYKEEESIQFIEIIQHQNSFEQIQDFSTFLYSFVTGKIENCDCIKHESFQQIKNSLLVLRFLRTLKLSENFFNKLILKCAAYGSKNELLAALDAPFEGDGRILSVEAQNFLSHLIDDEDGHLEDEKSSISNQSSTKEEQKTNEASNFDLQKRDEDFEELEMKEIDQSECSTTNNSFPKSSVILTAIEYSNVEVIDYLLTYCAHLIVDLPFTHQIRISTTALVKDLLNPLCDLLEYYDFPFPENFVTDSISNERLKEIITERMKLENAIKVENFEAIEEFRNNSDLIIAYGINNKSALQQAVNEDNYKVYFILKSLNFVATEFNTLEEVLNNEEMKQAKKEANKLRESHVLKSLTNDQRSIDILCIKSSIHNKKISKDEKSECFKKIKKWYEDISMIEFGPELLDVAASSNKLKIIFDFESESVKNVSVVEEDASGSTYPVRKWIFIGAQLSGEEREQDIKGVLAHELCHYVMRLVYENAEKPYKKSSSDNAERFEKIVEEIDKWSSSKLHDTDDECSGIISSVFRLYNKCDFQPELIVRVVQILAQYDDDEEKSNYLQEKYKKLFDFFRTYVLPDLRRHNIKKLLSVRKMNEEMEILNKISSRKIEIIHQKTIEPLTSNKNFVVFANLPRLLLINIRSYLHERYGDLYDAQNIFIESQKLKTRMDSRNFLNFLIQNQSENQLSVYIYCSNGISEDLNEIVQSKAARFVFVASNKQQFKELGEISNDNNLNLVKHEIIYKWNDLKTESQNLLLKTKVNFQNSSKFTLFDLLKKVKDEENLKKSNVAKKGEKKYLADQNKEEVARKTKVDLQKRILQEFSEIIDDHLWNMLIEETQITINTLAESEPNKKHFELLFQRRNFIMKANNYMIQLDYASFFSSTKKQEYVLISDIAGTGKSWIMKSISNDLREKYPQNWVTYVDLKQFISDFMERGSDMDILKFMTENVLKSKSDFEIRFFTKLYENGKVFILFDGFDEIAPDCADFVTKLITSFKSHEGNQLLIATRDYFEVNLEEELKVKSTYKLEEFSEDDGINLIAKSWLINDLLNSNKEIKSRNELEEIIKKSLEFENYKKIAQNLYSNLSEQSRSIGLPQLFKMIADICMKDKDTIININLYYVYEKFAEKLCEKWSTEKGDIRKKASVKSQKLALSLWKFLQFVALKSLFPNYTKIFFADYKECEWTDEEITACGFVNKIDQKYFFVHETFREFFLVDFVVNFLKNTNSTELRRWNRESQEDCILELLVKILTIEKFSIFRLFLNYGIDDSTTLKNIQEKMKKYRKNFYKMENFSELFIKNLEKLADFVIEILKEGNYKKVRKILQKNVAKIMADTKNTDSLLKFQDFLASFLKIDHFENLISEQKILLVIVQDNLDVERFKNIISRIEKKTGPNFTKEEFRKQRIGEHIINYLYKAYNLTPQSIEKYFLFIKEFFANRFNIDLLKSFHLHGENILHRCAIAEDEKSLKIIWKKFHQLYADQNMMQKFKNLIIQKDFNGRNLLDHIASCKRLNFHVDFWELLLESFADRTELRSIILQLMDNQFNFIIDLENPEIIEHTFNVFKDFFTDSQMHRILTFKGKKVQMIPKEVTAWKIIQKVMPNKKFAEFVNNPYENGRNLLHKIAYENSGAEFDFIMETLEKNVSRYEIRSLLNNLDIRNRNLLQSAAFWNESPQLHHSLWKNIRKYFERSEIIELIKHVDKENGYNVLFCACSRNNEIIVEITWDNIEKMLTKKEQIEYLMKDKYFEKLIEVISSNLWHSRNISRFIRNRMNELIYCCQIEE